MKYKLFIVILLLIFIIGKHVPYKYNSQKAVEYATQEVEEKSRCMCAWYVMRAIQHGGCYPCGIYPAYAYDKMLPRMGFTKIDPDNIQKGDICVLSQNSRSQFGHIAIFNGQQWISDYQQKDLFPNDAYRKESEIHYFRQSDGWHTANIWVSPFDLYEYIKVLINNYKRIKLL